MIESMIKCILIYINNVNYKKNKTAKMIVFSKKVRKKKQKKLKNKTNF